MNNYILAIIFALFLGYWVYNGYSNYQNTLKSIETYIKIIENLNEAEKKEEDTFQKAFLFNRKEEIINDNLALEGMRIGIDKQPKLYKIKMFLSFLVLGPIYRLK